MRHIILYSFSMLIYTAALFLAGILAGRLRVRARGVR